MQRASVPEGNKKGIPKQSRPLDQPAPNKKPKLSAEPHKNFPAQQLSRRPSLPKSDTASQTESEAKTRQVGMYDRPWRKHMKPQGTDRQTDQQDAPGKASAAAKDKPNPVSSKV